MMKIARLFLLTSIAFAGCKSEQSTEDKRLISKEIYTMPLGETEVYALRLRLTSAEKLEEIGAAVQLIGEKQSWTDTLYLELRSGDTLETEVIFSEAEPSETPKVQTQIEFFKL